MHSPLEPDPDCCSLYLQQLQSWRELAPLLAYIPHSCCAGITQQTRRNVQSLTCLAAADSSVLKEVSRPLLDGQSSPRLKGWLAATLNATPPAAPQLRSHLSLLQGCNTTLDLIKDVGFEMALHYLAGQCLASHQAIAGTNLGQHSSGTETQPPFGMTGQTAGVEEEEAAQLSTALVADLSEKVCLLQVALAALRSTALHASVNFPKIKELITVLKDLQRAKSASHSIVFVKERKSVHAVVAMLREVPDLVPISFFAYTGRANTGSRRDSGTRVSGMKLTEQKNALRQFKEAEGVAVLVATAAAEEGIDIINCEMVVCYTVVETGRELAQRHGRARKAGSVLVNIIELEDKTKLDKACLAESNARVAQLQLSELSL